MEVQEYSIAVSGVATAANLPARFADVNLMNQINRLGAGLKK